MTRSVLRGGIYLVLLACVLLALLWWRTADTVEAPGYSFQTAIVSRGDLKLMVSSTGTLAAIETVAVGTEVSGTVAKVLVDYNDQVTKGQVLAILKPDLFNAAVADAQGAVDQAAASLELARQDLERNRPLFDKGYLSAQEFLPYRINVDKAKAGLDSTRANLARAQTNFFNSVVRSPIAGTVIQRSVDAGQTVAASLSTPTLFVIAKDLARMQIEAAVDETDIGQIRQVRLQPTTVQNVVTYTVIMPGSSHHGGVQGGAGSLGTLELSDVAALRQNAPLLQAVSPEVRVQSQVVAGANNWNTSIFGGDPEYLGIRDYQVAAGRIFSGRELATRAKVALVGRTVANQLFPGEDPVGARSRIRNAPFQIIGVLASKGQSAMESDQDDVILAPTTTVLYRLSDGKTLRGIVASAARCPPSAG